MNKEPRSARPANDGCSCCRVHKFIACPINMLKHFAVIEGLPNQSDPEMISKK